jgi:acyl carrier protein
MSFYHSPNQILESVLLIVSEQSGQLAGPESSLVDELGLDSLDTLSMTQAIEEIFPKVMPLDYRPDRMITVRDVAAYVNERLEAAEAKQAAAPKVAASVE